MPLLGSQVASAISQDARHVFALDRCRRSMPRITAGPSIWKASGRLRVWPFVGACGLAPERVGATSGLGSRTINTSSTSYSLGGEPVPFCGFLYPA